MDEDPNATPATQSSGQLVPPPKFPGTAVAAATPAPVPHRRSLQVSRRATFGDFVNRTLDAVDELADAVADGLGLRRA